MNANKNLMNILNNKKVWALGILFLMYFGISNLAFSQEQPETKSDEELQAQAFTNLNEEACRKKINSEWTGDDCKPKECEKLTLIPGKEKETCNNHPNYCTWNAVEGKCGTEKEFSFYNTLNTIYTTGTGFVSGLLSKSGMSEYKVIVDIPCDNAITKIVGGADCAKTKGYAKSVPLYVARLYQFGFGIVGVVALLMIIYGAAQYTLSAGGLQTEDAKEIIQNALYGLLLLFAAYLILYTINPGLVSIKAPTLTPINVEKFLVSKQLETVATAPSNTPAATQGQTIANCNVAMETGKINDPNNPIKTICKNCKVGYKLVSNKCEKTCSSSGTTYDLSSKKCLECAAAGVNIAKLIKDGVIKTDGDILGYFPNLPNDCPVLKITVSSGATTLPPVPPFQPPR